MERQRRENYLTRFNTLNLSADELERRWRARMEEEEMLQLAEAVNNRLSAAQQAMASNGAAPGGGPKGGNCIEFVINTTDGTFSDFEVTTSGPTNYTITWGDGTEDTGVIDGASDIEHEYADSDTEYNVRLCFDDASLVTELDFEDDEASLTSITGLQNLTNLERFVADDNNLTSVDFSGLSNLLHVDVGDNQLPGSSTHSLTSINLSGCTSLTYLRLDDSDFSAGFPDLSDCTSLTYIDFDQCGLVGSVNISNLPVLEDFDFAGNTELTELIISSTQPLGVDGQELLINDCALTQTAVDNILVALANSEITNGYIGIDNYNNEGIGTNAAPGAAGLAALTVLDGKGWSYDVTN